MTDTPSFTFDEMRAEELRLYTEHLEQIRAEAKAARLEERRKDKRDWFAGQALAGLMSDGETQAIISKLSREENANSTEYVAKVAYELADAMLKERQK